VRGKGKKESLLVEPIRKLKNTNLEGGGKKKRRRMSNTKGKGGYK